jgi:archaemetzincin
VQFIPPIEKAVNQAFGLTTAVGALLDDLDFALHQGRQQYHSTAILERLARVLSPPHLKVLGITDVDLFIPILTHVYGEAQLGGRSCIVSSCRLNQGQQRFLPDRTCIDRLIKEAVHELGHTFKLKHCPDPACIMHYCRNLHDVDQKSASLCRYCGIMLQDELKRLGLG